MAEQRKWTVVYGEYKAQQKRALDVITKKLSEIVDYTPTARRADKFSSEESEKYCKIFLGTKDNNPFIKSFADAGEISIPDASEGYTVKVTSPDAQGNQTVIVAGSDSTGVMYGASEFAYHYLGTLCHMTENRDWALSDRGFFELGLGRRMPAFEVSTSPAVRERGLWTWGHVVFDYRKYLENMADLRMNVAVIWNDFAPVNAREIVDYAHELGIKLIWGYSWGWNNRQTMKIDLSDSALAEWADVILGIYEQQYADTGADGIYFQTFTELDSDRKDGMLIAEVVTKWVNGVVKNVFNKYPDLRIQFGIHCESVKDHYKYVGDVDPRVEIIWENCGGFPYYYNIKTDNFEETDEFCKKIANLRGEDDKFGVVIKEMTKLDWAVFKHIEGPYVMGEASDNFLFKRTLEKEPRWRQMQSYWVENAGLYLRNIRTLRDMKKGRFCAVALVEDGMFECGAWLPVAMYAHGLWNPDVSESDFINNVIKWANVRVANV